MAEIISRHNKIVLSNKTTANSTTPPCNCRNKVSCPLEGKCRKSSVFYKACLISGNAANNYYSRYVCRTFQRLQDRIRQHVPKSIRNRTSQECKQPERPGKLANSIPHCDSAIGNHLLHNQKCASHYKDNQFFILAKARSDFHLSVLESIFITLRKPNLCRQKEFVYKHKLLV